MTTPHPDHELYALGLTELASRYRALQQARQLAPEADLAHVLDLAKIALRTGTMIDPENLLCDLLGLDELQLYEWLDGSAWCVYCGGEHTVEACPEHHGRTDEDEGARTGWPDQCNHGGAGSWHYRKTERGCPPKGAPDQSLPAPTRAREAAATAPDRARWRQAEAGTYPHLVLAGRALCAADDAGPWRTVAGVDKCAACLELEEVLGRHG
jgi:hypothetical protein